MQLTYGAMPAAFLMAVFRCVIVALCVWSASQAFASLPLVAGTTEGGRWTLSGDTLSYVFVEARGPVTIDVTALGYGDGVLLAADPYDHSAWVVTSGKLLVHVDNEGRVLSGYTLPTVATALTVALDQSIWVAGADTLWHFAASSRPLASIGLGNEWNETVANLAVDSLRDRLWIVGQSAIASVALNEAAAPHRVREVGGAIRASALDSKTGRLWLLVDSQLLFYDHDGRSVATLLLDDIDAADDGVRLAYDGSSNTVRLRTSEGVRVIGGDKRDMESGVSVVEPELDITVPLQVLPKLSLVRPPPNANTSDPRPEFSLRFDALCNGIVCDLPPLYLESLRLTASLDGQSIANQFRFDDTAAGATFVPSSTLPPGESLFSAQAVDRFGHRSNTVESRLMVLSSAHFEDVTPKANQTPTITLTSPADNATLHVGKIIAAATASDSDGAIARVDFFVDSNVPYVSLFAPPYLYPLSIYKAGTHKVWAKATDNQNGTRTTSVVTINVVNDAPSVTITSPLSGTVINETNVAITVTAHDTEGIQRIELYDGPALVKLFEYPSESNVTLTWNNVDLAAGPHTLKAVVYDTAGLTATASTVVSINSAPYVVLTAPVHCGILTGPTNVVVSADALDIDGSIVRVDFYQGSTLLGTAMRPPYALTWPNVGLGNYSVTAVATDNLGKTRTSNAVNFSVQTPNVPPTVSLAAPADGATFGVNASIDVRANASDDGRIVKVEFFAGTVSIGTVTTPPYAVTWKPTAAGNYTLTAKVTDNRGAFAVSAPVRVAIVANKPPTVSLTAPANNAKYSPPATVNLAATATDSDGTIAKVEFYQGTTLVRAVTAPPYTATWSAVAGGTYSFTAKATDNLGAVTTSSAVSVSVAVPPQVAIATPPDNSKMPWAGKFTIKVEASAPVSPINRIELFVTSNSSLPSSIASCPFTNGGTGVFSYYYCSIFLSFPPGNYLLTAKATDNAGSSATSNPTYVRVNSMPNVVLTAPTNGSTFRVPATIDVSATATIAIGDITKVDFFANGVLIGSKTTEPYQIAWNVNAAGTYSVTAKVSDDSVASVETAPVMVTVSSNAAPSVALTTPGNGAVFLAPAALSLGATAHDSDGTISKVDFYAGSTLVGTTTTAPYSVVWSNVPGGSYSLTAKAIDNQGGSMTSAPVSIIVDSPPAVTITSPAQNSVLAAGSNIVVTVRSSDSDGTLALVELLLNGVVLATANVPPNTTDHTLNAGLVLPAGVSVFTARAKDNLGAMTTSASVTATGRELGVSLTVPSKNIALTAPGDIRLVATPAISAGSVAKVEFFANGNLLASASNGPYAYYWSGINAGQYAITARVTDDSGLTANSQPVTVTVLSAPTVTIVGGLDGSTVWDDIVNVSGTFEAPPNSGVVINGRLAQVDDGGHFFANAIPLMPGSNSITAQVITATGAVAAQTINLTSAASAPFVVTASPTSGLEPLSVNFSITNRGAVPLLLAEIDGNSDGVLDGTVPESAFTDGAFTGGVVTYSTGSHTATVRIRDQNNAVIHTSMHRINVLRPLELEAKVRAVYDGMLDRLRVNDIGKALTAVTDVVYEKYSEIFSSLPNISTIVDQLGTTTDVTFNDEIAEYSIVRNTPEGAQRFLIYLIRGDDGIWRIEGM